MVDNSFRARERREQQRIRNIALEKVRSSLQKQLKVITNLHISSIPDIPKEVPDSYAELFDEDFCQALRLVDFSKQYPLANVKRTYLQHSATEFRKSRKDAKEAINTYGFVMDSELIRDVESVLNSSLSSMIIKFDETGIQSNDDFEAPDLLLAAKGPNDIIKDHLSYLLTLINYFDDPSEPDLVSVENLPMWREDSTPHAGTAIHDAIDADRYREYLNTPPGQRGDVRTIISEEHINE